VLFDVSVVVIVDPLLAGGDAVPVVLDVLLEVEPAPLDVASELLDVLGAGAGAGVVVVVLVDDVDVLGAGVVTVVVLVSRTRSVHAPSAATESPAISATVTACLLDCSIVAPRSIGRDYRCDAARRARGRSGR
jgi:hypothetical protein